LGVFGSEIKIMSSNMPKKFNFLPTKPF